VGVAVAIALVHGRRALAASVLAASTALLALLLLFTPAAAGDRAAYWHAARDIAAAHPFGGTGAGTFFLDYARLPAAHDAHSLYLQSTGELGLVGLGLVLALLLVPLATGLRRRLAAPVAGLATFALHAGVDWDWQLPVVTVAALALAAAAVRDRPR
jgi:O-antigen ligase